MVEQTKTMKAVCVDSAYKASVIEISIPEPKENEILIKVKACGICGTDVHIYHGHSFLEQYPIITGHEFSGDVVKIGSSIKKFKQGDRVAVEPNCHCHNCPNCLKGNLRFCTNNNCIGVKVSGGMAEYVCVPENAAFNIGDLPYEVGAFMEPLSCVLHGMDSINGKIKLGSKILITGAGPIGWLFIEVMKNVGAVEISILEKQQARLDFAKELGVTNAYSEIEQVPKDYYDVVVDCTGSTFVINNIIGWVRRGATILLFGVTPKGQKLGWEPFDIYFKGLTIQGSFTSERNSYQALALLQSKKVDVSKFVTHRFGLKDFVRGCEVVEKGLENVRKALICPEQDLQ